MNAILREAGPARVETRRRSSTAVPQWLDPLTDMRWMRLVERHPRASVFHTRGWLRALRRTYGYEPIVLAIGDRSSRELRAGIVLCRVRSWLTGRRLVSLPFSDHCEPLVDDEHELGALLEALERERAQAPWDYVELRPQAPMPGTNGLFAADQHYYLHQLDLRNDPEELLRTFHRNHVVRKIRRSEREALGYAEGRSDALLRSFYELLLRTRRRHHLPPQPLAWFRSVLDCLAEQALVRIASKDGRPIAGVVTLCHRRVMTYKYGASDARSHNLGGMQFLLWRTIQDAHGRGCRVLDMGRSPVENAGGIAFKSHWGATCRPLTYLRHPVPRTSGSLWAIGATVARGVFSIMPDRMLVATGTALYPHVG